MHAGMRKSQVGIITAGLFFSIYHLFICLFGMVLLFNSFGLEKHRNLSVQLLECMYSLKEGVYIELLDFSQ